MGVSYHFNSYYVGEPDVATSLLFSIEELALKEQYGLFSQLHFCQKLSK